MSNFASFVREELERQVTPTRTIGDLISQMSASTGIDQERIGHIINGAITELSPEQIAGIARILMVPVRRLQELYANDLAYLRFTGVFAEKAAKSDDMAEKIAKLIQERLEIALRPILVRVSELEDRALQRVRFEREPALAQATQEKSISTGTRIPAFDWLTDSMHGRVKAHLAPVEVPLEPSRTPVSPPAFEMLKRQLSALSI